jgi:kinesin family protein 11
VLERRSTSNALILNSKQIFEYDSVMWMDASQEEVFSRLNVEGIINSTLEGYSNTILTYGQTGSGKTYTLNGEEGEEGIIPRTASMLFHKLAKYSAFSVRVSYL